VRHAADTHTFKDGRTLRLIGERILVRTDPDSEESTTGLIEFPGGSMEHVYSTGTVLAFGWLKEKKLPDTTKTKTLENPIPIPELEVGQKCCFIRFLKVQDSNKQLRQRFEDDVVALKPEDILFLFTGNIQLGQ
jgi:co-chaperonin GroES (HSP10)